MSSHHNRRKRRQAHEIPVLIERVQIQEQQNGKTYEEANWAKLSPNFRAAHNRLRQARGLPPIPPPKIDLYVARSPLIKPIDFTDKELVAAAREGMGPTLMGGRPGDEGFTIK